MPDNAINNEDNEDSLAETENFEAWVSHDEEEPIYHLDIGRATLHFFQDEWDELVELFSQLVETK